MKNIILYLLIITTLSCCSDKKDDNLLLFNDIYFNLHAGEEVVIIDSKKKEMFNWYFDKESIQIPLFRCIKSDKYLIFIGIPVNTTVKKLSNNRLTQNLNQKFFEGDSKSYLYKKYSSENEQIITYARNFNNNLVYVLAITDSSKLSDSLFSRKNLSDRFKQ